MKRAYDSYEHSKKAELKRAGYSFDLTDEDDREFLEFKFRKSLEYKEWKRSERKRNKEWDKEEAIESIEKLSDLLTQVGQNHNVWKKQTGEGFLARIYIPGSQKAYLNAYGFLAEPYGSIYASQKRKINKATVPFHRWLEKVQNERDEKREMEYLRAVEQWVKSNNYAIEAGDISNLKKLAFNSYGKMYGGYSTHSLPTRNAEILSEDKKEIDRPKYVTEKAEYFEKEKGYDPDYAFPMAWSIYCKYKNPSSPRCTKDQKDYLINQGVKDPKKMKEYPKKASAQKVASQYMEKQAFIGRILDLFKEPERVQQKQRPKFNEAKVWFYGNPMFGMDALEVQSKLGMGRDNTALIEYKGLEIKVSVSRDTYQQGEERNIMRDIFTAVSATGLNENIPEKELQRFLKEQMKKARLSDRRRNIFEEPNGEKY